ncbi:fimbrial protein [Klebsiella aerogenes]|uniref:fimbrial protein n=1 Tax=Klebsiella aerogenes TaxID=548 RepID=UPI001F1A4282|nr:fimbrial protein [Klebsiella aerogenes]
MKRVLTGCILSSFLLLSIFNAAVQAATVTVKGTVVRPSCNLNNGNAINVAFGDVVISKIDGQAYKKLPLLYSLTCENPNDKLQFSISGTAAPFGSGLLTTSKSGLGIQFMSDNGKLPLNSGIVKFNAGERPALYAVPARNSSVNLATGDFSATATLSIDYQ